MADDNINNAHSLPWTHRYDDDDGDDYDDDGGGGGGDNDDDDGDDDNNDADACKEFLCCPANHFMMWIFS